jgi:hypothetical protein
MATLRDLESGAVRPLAARVLVGRSGSCALRLDQRQVSGEHATLMWSGSRWSVRDLGSRNGTFVDGERVEPGTARELTAGAKLGFGTVEPTHELVDDGPPSALARDLASGAVVTASDGILALPDPEHPEVVVFPDGRGQWRREQGDDEAAASDGEVVQAGGRSWQIALPRSVEGTATVDVGPTIDTISLEFAVSLNEEHVEITIVHRGKRIALEPREHGYVLLTLARARLDDAGLPLAEQGWLDRDRLLKMLQTDTNGLNVAIYRARGQLASAGVDGAAGVVDVRRGQRRLGIEPERIEVGPL